MPPLGKNLCEASPVAALTASEDPLEIEQLRQRAFDKMHYLVERSGNAFYEGGSGVNYDVISAAVHYETEPTRGAPEHMLAFLGVKHENVRISLWTMRLRQIGGMAIGNTTVPLLGYAGRFSQRVQTTSAHNSLRLRDIKYPADFLGSTPHKDVERFPLEDQARAITNVHHTLAIFEDSLANGTLLHPIDTRRSWAVLPPSYVAA